MDNNETWPMVEYTLMHKNIEVARIILDDEDGSLRKSKSAINPEHCPMGVYHKYLDGKKMRDWWKGRCIPASREGLRDMMEKLDIVFPAELIKHSFGLSLSDHYWVRPTGSELKWKDVNFFENPFSEDIGTMLFGKEVCCNPINLSSPDNTTEGMMKKRWKIIDGKRCLLKTERDICTQQLFNEVIASIICKHLGIPYIGYYVIKDSEKLCCVCEDFVDTSTELVTAARVIEVMPKSNEHSYYTHYVMCCKKLGIDIVPFMDRMFVLDYITINEDRHLNNFGILRNPDTLVAIGPAPIYDTGSCLNYDKSERKMLDDNVECKPFKSKFDEQLKLVSSFDWIDFDKLEIAVGEIESYLEGYDEHISPERARKIVELLRIRIGKLKTQINLLKE